jgi:hypothetical protein
MYGNRNQRQWVRIHRDRKRAAQKAWYQQNRIRVRAQHRAYYTAHREEANRRGRTTTQHIGRKSASGNSAPTAAINTQQPINFLFVGVVSVSRKRQPPRVCSPSDKSRVLLSAGGTRLPLPGIEGEGCLITDRNPQGRSVRQRIGISLKCPDDGWDIKHALSCRFR